METSKKLTFLESMNSNLRAYKIWWKLVPRYFYAHTCSAITKALAPFVTIWISAQLINELAGNRNPDTLFRWVLIELIVAAGFALLNGIFTRWSTYELEKAWVANDQVYMDKMLRLDFADIDRQYVYDLYSQIVQNASWASWGLKRTLLNYAELVTAIIQLIAGIALSISLFTLPVASTSELAFLNHPLCAILIVIAMLLVAILAPVCRNKGESFWANRAEEAKFGNRVFSFFGQLSHVRSNAVDLRIYNQQENVSAYYLANDNAFGPDSPIAQDCKGAMGLWLAASESISVILTAIIYVFVCLKAWAGAFGVGSVTQYIGAITNLFLGISTLLNVIGELQINGEFLKTEFEFLDIPNSMYQGSLTTEKRRDRQYEVEFRDVSFQYPGSDAWALRHVNMKFTVGSRLAVVGMNGSGKTTFIKLLCRLYDPTEGQILLNGIDIRKYRYDDYINIFSVVFQDFSLLALPLGENVAGSHTYDKEKVFHCLKDAGFAERLETMPNGLDTYLYKDLDKDGVEVSGGEAQKIAIARSLYKDAPFIILDEPTAALDPIAEAEIYSKFDAIAGDKTAIYISHRLSSCRFCDDILVFHEGNVVQQGSHESLVSDVAGKYFELWNAQAQYYT